MVSIVSLWLPILLSGIAVFVISSVIHVVLPYHRSDFKKVAQEDEVMAALRQFKIVPGDYYMPYSGNLEAMKEPAYLEKMEKGPVAVMTVMKNGQQSMAGSLTQWFVLGLLISVLTGYLAGSVLSSGATPWRVFCFVSLTAFLGHAMALAQQSIWYGRCWLATFKSIFDGVMYAVVTGGVFAWLWPSI